MKLIKLNGKQLDDSFILKRENTQLSKIIYEKLGKTIRLGLAVDYSMLRLLTEGVSTSIKRCY
ncbi:MAG: hypothetical protein OEQ12_03020 [Nitrosopumilus sp.]|nr:hypothetical protein [Nitrosopumilus sp.]